MNSSASSLLSLNQRRESDGSGSLRRPSLSEAHVHTHTRQASVTVTSAYVDRKKARWGLEGWVGVCCGAGPRRLAGCSSLASAGVPRSRFGAWSHLAGGTTDLRVEPPILPPSVFVVRPPPLKELKHSSYGFSVLSPSLSPPLLLVCLCLHPFAASAARFSRRVL